MKRDFAGLKQRLTLLIGKITSGVNKATRTLAKQEASDIVFFTSFELVDARIKTIRDKVLKDFEMYKKQGVELLGKKLQEVANGILDARHDYAKFVQEFQGETLDKVTEGAWCRATIAGVLLIRSSGDSLRGNCGYALPRTGRVAE